MSVLHETVNSAQNSGVPSNCSLTQGNKAVPERTRSTMGSASACLQIWSRSGSLRGIVKP
jgi:hypothetical protein